MNALQFLGENGQREVTQAVTEAEQKTSAQLACAVATESGRYDRSEAVVGLIFALLGLAAADFGWTIILPPGTWAGPVPLWLQAACVVAGFLLGNVVCTLTAPLRRLIVSAQEMNEEVERAAAAAFARLHVASTVRRSGVLIYVSLFERRVVVLLDEGAQKAAPPGLADQLVARAVEGLALGQRSAVLVQLVSQAGLALAGPLPAAPGDSNTLSDRVLVLHPR